MKARISLSAAITAGLLASGEALPRSAPTTLVIGPDWAVTGAVEQSPARFKVQANGTSTLVLNPDAAERFGARGGMFAVRIRVGPVAVNGRTAVMHFSAGQQQTRRRIGWFERSIAPGFDGVLGPAAVPQDRVVFQLRPARAGERRHVLPLADRGYGGVGSWISVDGQKVLVQWDLSKRQNAATGAAGVDLAIAYGGGFVGQPSQSVIEFGIARPVRQLRLARPLSLGPLQLDSFETRTTDLGDTGAIPDVSTDQNEIVVTARGKKAKGYRTVIVGSDAMAGCSSLTFDKAARQIVLMCI
jgi:hypothetical protein